jgi:arylsulfatase
MDYGSQDTRPNIVVVMADDMGYSDIGCFGSQIATPNINALSREGVTFTQMYNCGRCCPTRASLLTGLYPHQTGIGHMTPAIGDPVLPAYQGYLNRGCVTIAELLREHGYHTLMSGKWHIGGMFDLSRPDHPEDWGLGEEGHPLPVQRGFDEHYGTLDGCGSYYKPHTLMRNDRLIEAEGDNYYYTDAISEEAANMIRRHGNGGDPFFLYVAYTAPHWPLHAWPEDIEKYVGRYRMGWDELRKNRHEEMIGLGILDEKWKISQRHRHASAWKETRHQDWESMRMAVYAAQIDRMDQGIGRIMATLRELGIAENTIVMFLSDNGGCAEYLAEDGHVREELWPMHNGKYPDLGNNPGVTPGPEHTYMSYDLPWANASNTPFRLFKHWVHEGGISTPLIVSWPAAIKQPGLVHSPAHVVDIMATCVDITGAQYPEQFNGNKIHPLEGESLLKALQGRGWNRDKPLLWEHEGNCAVRQDNWKLVKKYTSDWELFNMEQDRTEQDDLFAKNEPKAKELIDIYGEWAKRCGVIPWDTIVHLAPYQDVLAD